MSFSDLVHSIEKDVKDVLLPAGAPSDTREVAALAKDAEGIAVTLDPELEPIFQAIGSVGNVIEGALHELGTHVGNLKTKLAQRAAAPVAPAGLTPLPGAAPVGTPDPAAPQPAADQAPPEAADPNPLAPPAEPAPVAEPAPAPSTEATPSPTPGTADPTGANPPEAEVAAAPTPAPTALETAEADFAGLSAEDKAAFETAEGLEATPPPAEPAPPA